MNSTENKASIFFADVLLPLHYANLRRGVAYLDRNRQRASYWSDIASRTGGMQRLSDPSADFSSVLGLLGKYWEQRNESTLLRLLPLIATFRQDLIAIPASDQDAQPLTEFVYPLF
jgi:hypothetical protein